MLAVAAVGITRKHLSLPEAVVQTVYSATLSYQAVVQTVYSDKLPYQTNN